MYFKKRQKTQHKHDLGKLFAWLALTTGLGSAAFWTIFPLIVNSFLHSEALVGVFFSTIAVITFCGSLASTVILRKFSRIKITKTAFLTASIAIIGFTLVASTVHLYAIEFFRALAVLLIGIVISLYVRDTAKRTKLGLAEGRYYLFANIGWLIGPVIGGIIAQYVSRDAVFYWSAALYLVSLLLFHINHKKDHPLLTHNTEEKTLRELWPNIKSFFAVKELRKVYLMAFGMNYWWAVSSIYIPLYIVQQGFGDRVVGWVIAGGILPLVLLEKWVGSRADKKGVRRYLAFGFFFLAIMTALFTSLPWVTIILILMAVANVGAAFVEPLQETYLFTVIKKKDEERFYGVYNTADPLANILGPLCAAGLVVLGGFSGVWIGSALILLILALFALSVKK